MADLLSGGQRGSLPLFRPSSTVKPRIYFRDGRWHADVGLMSGWAGGSRQDLAFRFVWHLNYAATAGDDIPW